MGLATLSYALTTTNQAKKWASLKPQKSGALAVAKSSARFDNKNQEMDLAKELKKPEVVQEQKKALIDPVEIANPDDLNLDDSLENTGTVENKGAEEASSALATEILNRQTATPNDEVFEDWANADFLPDDADQNDDSLTLDEEVVE
jgi:hypothetical protein